MYALVSLDQAVMQLDAHAWILVTKGRIYLSQQEAHRNQLQHERVVRLPDEVEFEAEFEWFQWAYQLMADLRDCQRERPKLCGLSLYPMPSATAPAQLHSSFESLVERFYYYGLFFVLEANNYDGNEVYLQPWDLYNWAALVEQAFSTQPKQVEATWRLLWTTAEEMLEWFKCRAGRHFGGQELNCGKSGSQPLELDCANDIVSVFSMLTMHCPDRFRPKEGLELENYVHGPFTEYWKSLRCGVRYCLPEMPRLALLRIPQLDKLPADWVWRRQVRTRRGRWFGTQDLLFYSSWKNAVSNQRRFRSYKEIAAKMQIV